MPVNENATYIANLFDPQVVGDMIDKKLVDKMAFAPLATIDNTLVGVPGDTITLPYYTYIGDATVVPEGTDMPIATLTQSNVTKKVTKFGRGVELTDEAVLSAYGDPRTEAVKQLRLAIASYLDNAILAELATIGASMTATKSATFTADDVADALTLFGEDIDGAKVLLVNPADYAVLRKADDWLPASDIAANTILRGTVGMVHGCQVVCTNKLTTPGNAYIVKPGAIRIILKRDTLVEVDRDIIAKSTIITADKHAVPYLYDASKAIMIGQPSGATGATGNT